MYDVILTTYELVLRDEEFFSTLTYTCLVADEAHRLKNAQSQIYQLLMGFKFDFKVETFGRA